MQGTYVANVKNKKKQELNEIFLDAAFVFVS